MTDPIQQEPSPTLKPGLQTSEGKLAAVSAVLSVLATVVPPLWLMFSTLADAYPNIRLLAAAVSCLGLLSTVLVSLGYTNARTALKKAALGLLLGFVVLGTACTSVNGVTFDTGKIDFGNGNSCEGKLGPVIPNPTPPPACIKTGSVLCTIGPVVIPVDLKAPATCP